MSDKELVSRADRLLYDLVDEEKGVIKQEPFTGYENNRLCEACKDKLIDGWLKYCGWCADKLKVRQNGGVLL